MTYHKEDILAIIGKLRKNIDVETYGDIDTQLKDLAQDINEDVFNIVVMGEFKRGKSTFINALIGSDILPTDILPETTTINALRYGNKPTLNIYYQNGAIKSYAGDMEVLKEFSAQNKDFIPEEINYVDISYPSEYLADGIMIIDTPGVSDINKQRCEITYGFVPKANAVLFLLDATSPLKRTEVEFIEDKLLNIGIDNIIFILNKYDLLFDDDEDEEDDDIVEDTIARIRANFTNEHERLLLRDIKVLPLSAKNALTGQLNNNEIMYNESGMKALKEELMEIFDRDNIEEEKATGYQRRLMNIIKAYIKKLAQEKAIHMASIEDLQLANMELAKLITDKNNCKGMISDYVDSSVYKIHEMTRKSLAHFKEKLSDDIQYVLEQYQQADFKSLIEGRITRSITKSAEQWYYKNGKSIDHLLKLIDVELSKGISRLFQQKISLQTKQKGHLENKNMALNLTGEDYTDTINLKSGSIVGGGMLALTFLSSGMLMPLMSLAVFPTLKNHFLKQKVNEAKEACYTPIMSAIEEIVVDMRKHTQAYVESKASDIKNNAELAFDTVLQEYKRRIEEEIQRKENSKEDRKGLITNIDATILDLEKQLLAL